VAFKSFLKSNFTGTGYFKALLGAGVGFNLWHYQYNLFLHPCRRPEQTGTYGAMWAICFTKIPIQPKHKMLKGLQK
jgi:hypothetical protein